MNRYLTIALLLAAAVTTSAQATPDPQVQDWDQKIETIANSAEFKAMTPAEHLAAYKDLLHNMSRLDALSTKEITPGSIDEKVLDLGLSMRHFDALPKDGPEIIEARLARTQYIKEQDAAIQRQRKSNARLEVENARLEEQIRIQTAKKLESSMLDDGIHATVRAIGVGHRTLRITAAGNDRVQAHKIDSNTEAKNTFANDGFTKLVLSNGKREWVIPLHPASATN